MKTEQTLALRGDYLYVSYTTDFPLGVADCQLICGPPFSPYCPDCRGTTAIEVIFFNGQEQ